MADLFLDYSNASGGGGGGGAYACSKAKMNKDDTIELIIGKVGSISSATINSSIEVYEIIQVTSGENGSDVSGRFSSYVKGSGGLGGIASGGNYDNIPGNAGGDGNTGGGNEDYHTTAIAGLGGVSVISLLSRSFRPAGMRTLVS